MRWNGIAIIVALLAGSAQAEHVLRVNNDDTLRAAARGATAGTHILIAPGTYAGGIYLEKLQGTEKEPIILEAEDAANPPTFKGGRVGFGHVCGRISVGHHQSAPNRVNPQKALPRPASLVRLSSAVPVERDPEWLFVVRVVANDGGAVRAQRLKRVS